MRIKLIPDVRPGSHKRYWLGKLWLSVKSNNISMIEFAFAVLILLSGRQGTSKAISKVIAEGDITQNCQMLHQKTFHLSGVRYFIRDNFRWSE